MAKNLAFRAQQLITAADFGAVDSAIDAVLIGHVRQVLDNDDSIWKECAAKGINKHRLGVRYCLKRKCVLPVMRLSNSHNDR